MKQKETLKYIVASLKKVGGRAPTRVLEPMWTDDSYNYRWGCQQLKKPNYTGEIIAIDKSVWPNEWYLT